MDFKELLARNISTIFLVPALEFDANKLFEFKLLNAFMFREKDDLDVLDNVIYLCFSPEDFFKFEEFITPFKEGECFLTEEMAGENIIVIQCKLPAKWESDYQKILKGRYSKLSEGYRKLIPQYIEYNKKVSMYLGYSIINKTAEIRNLIKEYLGVTLKESDEYWTVFDIQKETLIINNLLANDKTT